MQIFANIVYKFFKGSPKFAKDVEGNYYCQNNIILTYRIFIIATLLWKYCIKIHQGLWGIKVRTHISLRKSLGIFKSYYKTHSKYKSRWRDKQVPNSCFNTEKSPRYLN